MSVDINEEVRKYTTSNDVFFIKEGAIRLKIIEYRPWYKKWFISNRFHERWLRVYECGARGLRLEIYKKDPKKFAQSPKNQLRTILLTNTADLKRHDDLYIYKNDIFRTNLQSYSCDFHEYGTELFNEPIGPSRAAFEASIGRKPHPQKTDAPRVQLVASSHSEIEGWLDRLRDINQPLTHAQSLEHDNSVCLTSILDDDFSQLAELTGRIVMEFSQTGLGLVNASSGESLLDIEVGQLCEFDVETAREIVDEGRLFVLSYRPDRSHAAYLPELGDGHGTISVRVFTREGGRLSGLIMRLLNPTNDADGVNVQQRHRLATLAASSAGSSRALSHLHSFMRRSLPSLFDGKAPAAAEPVSKRNSSSGARNSHPAAAAAATRHNGSGKQPKRYSSTGSNYSETTTMVTGGLPSVAELQAAEAARGYERQLQRNSVQSNGHTGGPVLRPSTAVLPPRQTSLTTESTARARRYVKHQGAPNSLHATSEPRLADGYNVPQDFYALPVEPAKLPPKPPNKLSTFKSDYHLPADAQPPAATDPIMDYINLNDIVSKPPEKPSRKKSSTPPPLLPRKPSTSPMTVVTMNTATDHYSSATLAADVDNFETSHL